MPTPTTDEISHTIDLALQSITEYGSENWQATYEEGVVAALEWILGITNKPPVEEKEALDAD